MHVNNEIGVIQDIESIGRQRERYHIYVDAAQSAGNICRPSKIKCRLNEFFGHKYMDLKA